MAKPGDRIYFGKCVNASVDTVWVVGVVADTKYRARTKIRSYIELMEMELVECSIGDSYELFENLQEEKKHYKDDKDFFIYDPDSLN